MDVGGIEFFQDLKRECGDQPWIHEVDAIQQHLLFVRPADATTPTDHNVNVHRSSDDETVSDAPAVSRSVASEHYPVSTTHTVASINDDVRSHASMPEPAPLDAPSPGPIHPVTRPVPQARRTFAAKTGYCFLKFKKLYQYDF